MVCGLSAGPTINCFFVKVVGDFFNGQICWVLAQQLGDWATALYLDALLVRSLRPMEETCPTLGGDTTTKAQFQRLLDLSPTLMLPVLGSDAANLDHWASL